FARGSSLQRDDVRSAMEPSTESPRAGGRLSLEDLVRELVGRQLDEHAGPGCEPGLTELMEKELIVEALRRANGNQSKAAELLRAPRPTLHAKLQRHRVRTTTVVDDANGQRP